MTFAHSRFSRLIGQHRLQREPGRVPLDAAHGAQVPRHQPLALRLARACAHEPRLARGALCAPAGPRARPGQRADQRARAEWKLCAGRAQLEAQPESHTEVEQEGQAAGEQCPEPRGLRRIVGDRGGEEAGRNDAIERKDLNEEKTGVYLDSNLLTHT